MLKQETFESDADFADRALHIFIASGVLIPAASPDTPEPVPVRGDYVLAA